MEDETPPLHPSGEEKRMAMAIALPLLKKVRPDGHGTLVETNWNVHAWPCSLHVQPNQRGRRDPREARGSHRRVPREAQEGPKREARKPAQDNVCNKIFEETNSKLLTARGW